MLRAQIDQITRENYKFQPALLDSIKPQFNHSIKHIQSPPNYIGGNYICYEYAFDLINCKDYMEESYGFRTSSFWKVNFHIFISKLIGANQVLVRGEYKTGNIILYFNNENTPVHAGIIDSGNQIISKWGTGNLWKHGIFEVPSSYGDAVGIYKIIDNNFLKHIDDFLETTDC